MRGATKVTMLKHIEERRRAEEGEEKGRRGRERESRHNASHLCAYETPAARSETEVTLLSIPPDAARSDGLASRSKREDI